MSILRSLTSGNTSQITFALSKAGVTSDAPNGLEWGVTAPSGTGQEAAINNLIASANALAVSLGVKGIKLVWDVACTLSGPVFLTSNLTIEAPHYGCGAIMRAGSDSPVFMVQGMQLDHGNGAYTGAGAVQTQRSFGKFDPAKSGAAHPEYYRVFDPAFVNASNIEIIGGTWNGYYAGQTIQPPGTQHGLPFITRLNIGYTSIMTFFGVDGLKLRGLRAFNGTHFGLNFCNVGNLLIEDCDIDQLQDYNYGSDALHLAGPIAFLKIVNSRTHCADDHIALNADDLANGPPTQPDEGLICGVNWQCSAPITDVDIRNHLVWGGREGVTSWGALCLRSNVARIDRINIDGLHGITDKMAIQVPENSSCLVSGPGNIGRVSIRNMTLDCKGGNAVVYVAKNIETLEIQGRYRGNAQPTPDILLTQGNYINLLKVESYTAYQPAAAQNNTSPAVTIAGTVRLLRFTGTTSRDPGVSVSAAPLLTVQGSGTVTTATVEADADGILNMVSIVSGGTIGTLTLAGSHLNTGGGSPLANSGTVTDLMSRRLTYRSGSVAAFTGTAPGSLNQLGDAPIVVNPPGQVTGLTASNITANSMALAWTAPASGGTVSGNTVAYRLTGSGAAFTTVVTGSTATTYTLSGLSASKQYDVKVFATNAGGPGADSAVITPTTIAAAAGTLLAFTGAAGAPTGNQVLTKFLDTTVVTAGVLNGTGSIVFDGSDALGTLGALGKQANTGLYTVNLSNTASMQDVRMVMRASTVDGTATAYIVQFGTGSASIIKFTNGSFQGAISAGSTLVGYSRPTTSVGVRLDGSALRLFVDGASIGGIDEGSANAITTAGYIGIGANQASISSISYTP